MKKALIIGLNEYTEYPLQYCENDATEISNLIETNGDNSHNFDVRRILKKCSNDNLERFIKELFKDDTDIAMLYFAGHGCDVDGGYICGTDSNSNNLGVKMEDILTIANKSNCKNKIIILDCCFSANLGKYCSFDNNSHISDGLTIMTACQSWQMANENSDLEHGLYTSLLIEGLKGGAANIKGEITAASLYSFVDQSLGAWQQRPVFKTNISEFLPIRSVPRKVSKESLQNIIKYFKKPNDYYNLNPSFEFTNNPKYKPEIIEPYTNDENVRKFKELQLFESVGLVEPVGTEHMYFAAMHNKSCRLTKLGQHYWRLARDKRI